MRLRLLLLLAALAAPGQAQAQSCSVNTEAVLFDSYDTLSPLPANGVGAVHVTCDGAVPFSVGLGAGIAGGATRAMQSGTDRLEYGLYADPSRQIPWGDGATAPERSGSGPDAQLTVYGRIPARQNVPAGSYADSVVVTISF
jgi:spore coat protein U-like protein